jgi:cobalt-zinc-cadmium efflux system membrane fusion protein
MKIKMKNYKSSFTLLAAVFMLLMSSCGNKNAEADETKKEVPATEPSTVTVSVTKKQFASLNIQLGDIEQKNLSSVLKATGNLSVPPENKANITSILGGTVQSILIKEGDHVTKGQTLVTLINPEFIKLQQEYLESSAELELATTELERQKTLSEKNVTAQKTYQQAQSNSKSLKAKVSSLKSQLSLLYINSANLTAENISAVINITAPINGNISGVDVNIGATVDATTHLMDIVDNSHLHLDVFVFEQDLPKIKNNQLIDFTLTNLQGKHFTAKIFSVGAAFEGESKTIPIHAEILGDNNGLIEGMNVTAGINIGDNLTSAVLTSAIISNAGNDYIFIQTEGHKEQPHQHSETETVTVKEELGDVNTFKKIQIKRGVTNGSFTEITPLQSIHENAKVVTNAAFYLMAMLNAPTEE